MPLKKDDFSAFDNAINKTKAINKSEDDFSAFDDVVKKKAGQESITGSTVTSPTPSQSPSEGGKSTWETSPLNPEFAAKKAQEDKEKAESVMPQPKPDVPVKINSIKDFDAGTKSFYASNKKDITNIPKPVTQIDIEEGKKKYEQHKKDVQLAIDNTTARALQAKGIKAAVNSPAYIQQRKQIENAVSSGDATYRMGKDGVPGLDRTIGWWEGLTKGWNESTTANKEAEDFSNNMTTEQRVEYVNRKMEETPKDGYIGEQLGLGGAATHFIGENAPFLGKAVVGAGIGTAAIAAAPETLGASIAGLPTALSFVFTAPDMANQGAMQETIRRYQVLKTQNPNVPDVELMKQAEEGGIRSGAIGGLITNAALMGTSLKMPISAEGKSVLGKFLNNSLKSAAHMGVVSGGVTAAQQLEAGLEGVKESPENIVKNSVNSALEGAKMGFLLHAATEIATGAIKAPKAVYSAIKHSLKDIDPVEIHQTLQANENAGVIPPGTADKVTLDLQEFNKGVRKTADGLTPETEVSVAGLMQAKDKLAEEMSHKDPSQIASYQQKIDALNDRIAKITETNSPFEHEVDDLTGKPINGQISEAPIEKVNIEGELPEKTGVGEVEVKVEIPELTQQITDLNNRISKGGADGEVAKQELAQIQEDPIKFFENRKELAKQNLADDPSLPATLENYDSIINKLKENDSKNISGLSGEVGVGKEPIETQPIEGGSAQETGGGGVLQAPGIEGEVKATEPKVGEVAPIQKQLNVIEENLNIGDIVTGNISGEKVVGKVTDVGIHKGQIVVDITDQNGKKRFLYSKNIENIEPKAKEIENLTPEQNKRYLELLNKEELTAKELDEYGTLGKIKRGEMPNEKQKPQLELPKQEGVGEDKGIVINPKERTEWEGYKVGDVIDGNKLDELSGNLVGNKPKEKFILVQTPLSEFTDNRNELLSQEKGYEQEEIDRLESMKSNFEKTPPIPDEGDGMHRIIAAKELGNETILQWKNVKDVKQAELPKQKEKVGEVKPEEADIEKRRQEELESKGLNRLFPLLDEANPEAKKIAQEMKEQQKSINEVNAKYDAELNALKEKQQSELPKQKEGEVNHKEIRKDIQEQVNTKDKEARDAQQKSIDEAKADKEKVLNNDKDTIDKYVKKSGYKLITEETKHPLGGDKTFKDRVGQYYKQTSGLSVTTKTGKQVALDAIEAKSKLRPSGLKVNAYENSQRAAIDFEKGKISIDEFNEILKKDGLNTPKSLEVKAEVELPKQKEAKVEAPKEEVKPTEEVIPTPSVETIKNRENWTVDDYKKELKRLEKEDAEENKDKIEELTTELGKLVMSDLFVRGTEPEIKALKEEGKETSSIKNALDKYEEGNDTFDDFVNNIEGLAFDEGNKNLQDAVDAYREEQRYNTELKGRGDMDAAEEAFMATVRKEAATTSVEAPKEEVKPTEKVVGEVKAEVPEQKEEVKDWKELAAAKKKRAKASEMAVINRVDAKKTYNHVNSIDTPTDPYGIAKQWLASGGKVSIESFAKEVMGLKRSRGAAKTTVPIEAKSSEFTDSKSKISVEKAAHNLWESLPEEVKDNTSDMDIRDSLIDLLSSYAKRIDIARDFVSEYDAEAAAKKYYESISEEFPDEVNQEQKAIEDWMMSEGEKELSLTIDDEYINQLKKQYEQEPTGIETTTEKPAEGKAAGGTEKIGGIEPVREEKAPAEEIKAEAPKEAKLTGEKAEPPVPPTVTEKGTIEGGEDAIKGITMADNAKRRAEINMPERQPNPETVEQWRAEAEKKIAEGYNINDLIDKMEKGEPTDKVENEISRIFAATLDAEVKKNPSNENINRYERLIKAREKSSSEIGKALRSLQGFSNPFENISDFYVAKKEALKVDDLTETQKAEVQKDYENVQKARDEYEAKWKEAEAKFAEMQAQNEILRQQKEKGKKYTKEGKRDYAAERQSLKDQLKSEIEKYKNNANKLGIASDGGAENFVISAKMAKIIGQIAKSHVEQTGAKLIEVTQRTFDDVKDLFEGITTKDIHDVIAGKYSERKETKSELIANLRQIQAEAKLLNELDRVLAGEPKTEKARVEKNQKLADLRRQINDVKKNNGLEEYSDESKAKKAIEANKKKEEKLKERIANEDFEPEKKKQSIYDSAEFKKENPKLYKELLDSQVKKQEAELEFHKKLVENEMANMGNVDKFKQVLTKARGTLKAIFAGIDDSAVGVQNWFASVSSPVIGAKAIKNHILDFWSEKRFDRYLAELHNSPDWYIIKESGVKVSEPKSLLESGKEEMFPDRFKAIIKIKGKEYGWVKIGDKKYELFDVLKPFERAFTSLGNSLRVIKFRTEAEKMYSKGITFENNPEEFKKLATRINAMTSASEPNKAFKSDLVNLAIWSPRLMASKLNILGISDLASYTPLVKQGYYRSLGEKGKILSKQQLYAAADLAKFATSVVAGSYLYAAARGGQLNTDPYDNNFMDVELPNGKSYNFTGGFSKYISTLFQVARGGKTNKLTGEFEKYKGFKDRGSEILHFLRGKMPPISGSMVNLAVGKDYTGKETSLSTEAEKYKMPMAVGQIYDQIQKDGYSSLFMDGLPTFLGINVKDKSTYKKTDLFTEEELVKSPNVKLLTASELSIPSVRSKDSYNIREDVNHLDGKMKQEEYDKFKPLLEEYSKEKIEKFSSHYKKDLESLNKMINQEDKSPELKLKIIQLKEKLQNKLDSYNQDAIKKAKRKIGLK